MPIDFACQCGQMIRASDDRAGGFFLCPTCKSPGIVPDVREPEPPPEISSVIAVENPPPHPWIAENLPDDPTDARTTWEYKVLTRKDHWFQRTFDPEVLEAALNDYAKYGWRLRGMATADFPGWLYHDREELIFVLERRRPG